MRLTKANYKAPTPWKVRRLADSVLVALGGGGVVSVLAGLNPIAGAIVAGIGIVAKIVSNYCAEKPPK